MVEAGLVMAARVALALVFATAALAKVRDIGVFAATIRDLGFGRRTAHVLAPVLIAGEGLAAVLMLSGLLPVLAAALVGVLLAAFAAAALSTLMRERTVTCSCFGADGSVLGISTIARCGLLAVPTVMSGWPVEPGGDASLERTAAATLVGALALGSLLAGRWMLALPTLLALMRERRLSAVLGADRPAD